MLLQENCNFLPTNCFINIHRSSLAINFAAGKLKGNLKTWGMLWDQQKDRPSDGLALLVSHSRISRICYFSRSNCWSFVPQTGLAAEFEIELKTRNSLHAAGMQILFRPFLEILFLTTAFFLSIQTCWTFSSIFLSSGTVMCQQYRGPVCSNN